MTEVVADTACLSHNDPCWYVYSGLILKQEFYRRKIQSCYENYIVFLIKNVMESTGTNVAEYTSSDRANRFDCTLLFVLSQVASCSLCAFPLL